jgi:hypothetical protein
MPPSVFLVCHHHQGMSSCQLSAHLVQATVLDVGFGRAKGGGKFFTCDVITLPVSSFFPLVMQ